MPTSNERKMLSSNEALKELNWTMLYKWYADVLCLLGKNRVQTLYYHIKIENCECERCL